MTIRSVTTNEVNRKNNINIPMQVQRKKKKKHKKSDEKTFIYFKNKNVTI